MRMPGGAGTRLERDACTTHIRRSKTRRGEFGRLEQRVNANCTGKIFGRSFLSRRSRGEGGNQPL